MKKIIFSLIILIFVSTIAYAEEFPGIPGRWIMHRGFIEFGTDGSPEYCGAYEILNEGPPEEYGESIGNNTNLEPDSIKFIKIVVNREKVVAACKFTDESIWYEANAQVGEIVECYLSSEEATCGPGTGQITVAANHEDETGGTAIITCKFDPENCYFPPD